jgi:hypothetical protein
MNPQKPHSYPRLYLDAEDVERGYYVYAHICKKSGKVFYVGKGHEKRAWSDNRSNAWHEHVATLEAGYEVHLLHTDLTEEESIDSEREEIEANGGAAALGGSLINWIPGQTSLEIGVGFTLTVEADTSEKEKRDMAEQRVAYRATRKLKPLSREEKSRLAKEYKRLVWPPFEPIESLYRKYEDQEKEDRFPETLDSFRSAVNDIGDFANRVSHSKISFIVFVECVDDEMETLEDCVEGIGAETLSKKHFAMCRKTLRAIREWSDIFDTGNRQQAADAAKAVALRQQFGPNGISDEEFAKELEESRKSLAPLIGAEVADKLTESKKLIRELQRAKYLRMIGQLDSQSAAGDCD